MKTRFVGTEICVFHVADDAGVPEDPSVGVPENETGDVLGVGE